MRSNITITFNARQQLEYAVDISDTSPEAQAKALEWLEATWTRLGCEPVRHSGKVLLLDKVLGVADSLGYDTFVQHEDRAQEFVQQVATALARPVINIDLPGLAVGF
ncbi:hypothetical protein VRY85_00725 [Achromobacter sp. F4_2707]|uniref:hypothetical protein n=1 Tax=Achromobacter sp. F4_2707 TaxID=3114286 RepID=UPI0039C747AE